MAVIGMGGLIDGVSPAKLATHVEITSTEILALHTTPVEVIPDPGDGWMVILDQVVARKPAGTAYGGVASDEDLEFRYTDASGTELMDIETTGFLDQANTQRRVAGVSQGDYIPTTSAPVVVSLPGAITTGDTSVFLDCYYRVLREPA